MFESNSASEYKHSEYKTKVAIAAAAQCKHVNDVPLYILLRQNETVEAKTEKWA